MAVAGAGLFMGRGASGFGDERDRDPEPFNVQGMRGTLPGGRIGREPASPLLVHPGEVLRVAEDEGRAHDLVDRAPRSAKDGVAVAEDLPGLLLDGGTDDGPGGGIERALATDEDEPPATTAWLYGNVP